MALNGPKESKKRFDADAVRNRWVLIYQNSNLQIIDVPSQDVFKVLNDTLIWPGANYTLPEMCLSGPPTLGRFLLIIRLF